MKPNPTKCRTKFLLTMISTLAFIGGVLGTNASWREVTKIDKPESSQASSEATQTTAGPAAALALEAMKATSASAAASAETAVKEKQEDPGNVNSSIAAGTNLYDRVPSVESLVDSYMDLPESELKKRLKKLTDELANARWIERANQNLLTHDERQQLAALLQEDSALRLAALQLKLSRIEKDYL